MESVGEKLKKIRLQKGISLEEVHKKTKINLDILRAIEENNSINLSPIYLKGFLKIYCKFLGVHPEDYIVDYKETKPMREISQTKEELPAFFKSPVVKKPILEQRMILRIALAVMVILFIFGLFKIGKKIFSKSAAYHGKRANSVLGAGARKPESPAKIKESLAPKSTQTGTAGSQQERTQLKEVLLQVKLGLQAKQDCWVSIKVDGHLVFQGIIKKGRSKSWQGKERIEISLNNATSAQLEVNNKVIPPLGRKGQPLKNIVITRDGKISVNQ
jgi:cytoskeleton protein RodZ